MKTYIKPAINAVDLQSKDNILLGVSSGGNNGPIKGTSEDQVEGGNRVPLRYLY